ANRIRYVSPQLRDWIGVDHRNGVKLRKGASSLLTLRESEVLNLMVSGNRTGEIAHILHISRKTVETHRGAIMRKLHLHRLADVVRYAVQNDLCLGTLNPEGASG